MLDRKNPPVQFQFPEIVIPEPETSHLSNGLPIHIFKSTNQPIVKLEIILRNGGHKTDSKIGTSLLLSKTLQSGTKSYSAQDITNLLAQKGAFLEVSSSFDYSSITVYSLVKHFAELLPLIYEIIFLPTFPEKEVELQRNILISGLRTQNRKTSVVASKHFRQSVLGEDSSYGKIITEEHLLDLSSSDLSSAYKSYSSNIELIINGNISTDIKSILNNYFINAPYTSEFNVIDSSAFSIQDSFHNHLPVDNSIQTSIRIGNTTLNKSHKDFHKLSITNYILGGYFGSRLMSNIREEKGLTYGIYSSIVSLNNAAYYVIGSDVNGKDKELAIGEIIKEVDKLQDGVKFKDELKLVKNHLLGSFQSDLSSPLSLSDKFKSIHLSNMTYQYYHNYLEEIRKFTEEDMVEISKKYFTSSKLSYITAGA